MDIKVYAQVVANFVECNMDNVEVEVKNVIKNNGVEYTGIAIRKVDSNIGASIYINEFYEEGDTPEETADKVIEIFNANKIPTIPDMNFFSNYEEVKKVLKAKLVNADNKQYVGISAKKYGYDDLKIVPYVNVESIGIINITKEHMKMWDKKIQSIVSEALKNMQDDIKMQTMQSFIAGSMGIDEEILGDSPMKDVLIVTTKDNMNGAIAAITARNILKEKYKGNYVVLPSSIHEVLVLENNENIDEMTEMVKAVNSQCVAPEEVLSDKAYKIEA